MKRVFALAVTLATVLLFGCIMSAADTTEGEADLADSQSNYLTFTAEEDNSSVTLNYDSGSDVKYSIDGGSTWNNYTNGNPVCLTKEGSSVKFKGNGVTTTYQKHFAIQGKVAASGDVTSLTNSTGGDCSLSSGCYSNMFSGCTGLTEAPELPATTLADSCYGGMFRDCTGLTKAPELPATTLAKECYSVMFSGCSGLSKTPELPATTLTEWCYYGMFTECTGLTEAPELPATTLAELCYGRMFYCCPNIKLLEQATDDCTEPWSIPSDAVPAMGWNDLMFTTSNGKVADEDFRLVQPEIGKTYYYRPWVDVTSISLDKTVISLDHGNSTRITASVLPENANIKDVIWSSSDEAIATVDNNGFVSAISVGTATITATTVNGNKTAECKVTVGHFMDHHAAVAATYISAGNSEYWYCTTCGKYFSDAAGTAEIATDSWVIPKLVAVESVKLDKTSVSAGTSVTEINEKNGNPVKSSGNLVVTNASTVQLIATVSPANATDKSLTWTSSDETVATVDKNGLVTVLRYGKATITATAADGSGASATCTVQGKFYDANGSATKGETDYQYFYNPVYWAADNGITTGYDYVYFGTDRNCSRRELMIFLWRMAGKPEVSEYTSASTPYVDPYEAFSDMGGYGKSTATYQAVAWGVTVGITKGFGNGTFRPDANITRKDTMIMIYRAAGKPKWNWNSSRTEDDFNNTYCSDVKSICEPGSDTYNSIAWAYTNKITNGYTSGDHKGKFGYELDILRKDIVTFLYRYNNLK